MRFLARHWVRIAVSLIPLILALGHASGLMHLGVVQSLDNIIYDARLRLTMPKTLDSRIVIVDIDEKSLAEFGHWPWSRNKLADLATELLDHQKADLLGFDVVFSEPDDSSGLARLRQLGTHELRNEAAFQKQLTELQQKLDYDVLFAQTLVNKKVVLGYYFTSDRGARVSGVLPAPVVSHETLQGHHFQATVWDGFGSNIEKIASAAPRAGFFNAVADDDGVVRAIPLLAQYQHQYYESFALAMYRVARDIPVVVPGFPKQLTPMPSGQSVDSILLGKNGKTQSIAVDDRAAVLIPFRGYGGASGGSFQYFSAADILSKRLQPGQLQGKMVLVGSTAPGLQDLRVTPVGQTYPGVETHANLLSSMLDGRSVYRPDYAIGYEIGILLVTGLLLVFVLPVLGAARALALNAAMFLAVLGLNSCLFLIHGMVLPLASVLLLTLVTFTLNMSYGYFVESRSKRELTKLFGRYVPPQLVEKMVAHSGDYTMRAKNSEMTVMFCDLRGFTRLAETMEPTTLQEMLNGIFNHFTQLILQHHGTIDKYMGDCVMAFWGAPVSMPNHADLAVLAAMDITHAVLAINQEHRSKGYPEIRLGIGINTGIMCVGDMGSFMRRSFTVVGDAVNLASRLEELTKIYAVEIMVSDNTRHQTTQFVWQEIDKVRVDGKKQVLEIYSPMAFHPPESPLPPDLANELALWNHALQAYRAQAWERCGEYLQQLIGINSKNALYSFYARRIALLRLHPPGPAWDGTSDFDSN
ncbi:MAG: adenylate/guanylate cyclase domain-containing protein [Burkholderiaceae bacterium]